MKFTETQKCDTIFSKNYLTNDLKSNENHLNGKPISRNISESEFHLSANNGFNSCVPEIVDKEIMEKDFNSMSDSSHFMPYLNLISVQTLDNKSINELKTCYPLRKINRIKPLMEDKSIQLLDKTFITNEIIFENSVKKKKNQIKC